MNDQPANADIVILTALYRDWPSFQELVARLDKILTDAKLEARVVVVDDGSPIEDSPSFSDWRFDSINDITKVTLLRNLGNQRALAMGVGYIANEIPCSYLVIMDSDLEDRPEYVPALIAEARRVPDKVIFGARTQRSEGPFFKIFYWMYKTLYNLLTGHPISIGNFSVIPGKLVRRVAGISEIMTHYPAGIMRARIPYTMLDAARGQRIFGQSKMNFVSLVIHGLSGLAVHADVVGVRAILAVLALSIVVAAMLPVFVFIRLFTDIFLLGWTSQMVAILAGILFQALVTGIFIVFVVLTGKGQYQLIPLTDYRTFVLEADTTPVRHPR